MNIFKKIILLGFISSLALSMLACGSDTDGKDEKEKAKGDHVWKHQTDALQSAKDVTKKMQENMKQQQEKMDEYK